MNHVSTSSLQCSPTPASDTLFKHMSDTYHLTLFETELQEIRDAANQCERLNVCEWKQDEAHGYWEGGCGLAWEFTAGTPETNGFWCCPRCGRRIKTPNAEVSDQRGAGSLH